MNEFINQVSKISFPPSGSVNASRGTPIEGPGGKWVPCATALQNGSFIACLYEVGPGRRQVCGDETLRTSEEEALRYAVDLALVAAA